MKTLQHKIKTPPSTTVLLVASGLLLLSFITYHFVYLQYKARHEKQQFEAASSELRQIAKEIQTKVGTADQVKEEKSCSYANRKFSQGPLSCSVSVTMRYSSMDNQKASKILENASSVTDGTETQIYGQTTKEFLPHTRYSGTQSIGQDLSSIDGDLKCSASYTYPESAGTGMSIYLVCGGLALAEHYE